jgi:hypothetical protein
MRKSLMQRAIRLIVSNRIRKQLRVSSQHCAWQFDPRLFDSAAPIVDTARCGSKKIFAAVTAFGSAWFDCQNESQVFVK